jgi:Ca-activated chloride channel family protein
MTGPRMTGLVGRRPRRRGGRIASSRYGSLPAAGTKLLACAIVLALGPPAPTRAAPAGASTTPAAGAGSAPVDAPRLVSGGGGFADAPLLGAGIYRDTLLPRETLFYAVSLQAGQRLRIRATIDLSVGSRSIQDIPDAAGGFPTITLFTPLRQQLPGIDLDPDDGGGLESVAVTAASPRVLSAAAANRRAAENEPWTGPGTYHFAIVLSQITRDLGATVELPLRLALATGDPPQSGAQATRAPPGPLGDPRGGPRYVAAALPGAAGRRATGGRRGLALLGAGGAGGLVVGAALGFVIAVRRRRR